MARQITASTLGTTSGTYLYALASNPDASLFASIGSDDSFRTFDPSLKLLNNASACHSGLSCLQTTAHSFVTAGRDGLIKVWDPRAWQPTIQLSEPQSRGISAIACQQEYFIAAGTESLKEGVGDVAVHIYDTRNASQPFRTFSESHTDTVTQLIFHPDQQRVLLSGSTDGLVSIFDVTHEDEDDALQQVLNPKSAVHHCGFLTPDQAYVLTADEQFLVYPLAEDAEGQNEPVVDFGDVRGALGCKYVIDVLTAKGTPLVAHGHNEDGTLAITQLDGGPSSWQFGPTLSVTGAHGEDVVRDVLVADDLSKAWSCGEDGNVRVWDITSQVTSSVDVDSEKPSKAKKKNKKSERFAPY